MGIDKKFSVNIAYRNNTRIEGIFGFGFDYKNNLKIYGNNFSLKVDRIFSPPSDEEIKLKTIVNNKIAYKNFLADAYANFFNSIIQTYETKYKFEWSETILKDAKISNKLRNVMDLSNSNE